MQLSKSGSVTRFAIAGLTEPISEQAANADPMARRNFHSPPKPQFFTVHRRHGDRADTKSHAAHSVFGLPVADQPPWLALAKS